MDNVIATRTYYRPDGSAVEVRLFQPIQTGETFYSCKVEVETPEELKPFTAFGGDSMQALVSALILAPDLLRQRGVTKWLKTAEGLGLPESDGTVDSFTESVKP